MRFLILTQYYPPEVGAAQLRLSSFAQELHRAGHQVEVATALPNYPSGSFLPQDRRLLARREMVDGLSVTRAWLFPATGAGMRRLVSYLSFTASGMVAALAARRPDVVFVESPPLFLGVAGWIAAKRFGAVFVLNISDLWPDSVRDVDLMSRGPWLRLAEGLERWLYRRADAVTAVTNGIRDRLIATKGVPRQRVLFLPNGVDTNVFRPVEPEIRRRGGRPMFLYAGTHGLAHGLDVVLEAAMLAPEFDFVLIGGGTDKQRLREKAVRLGATNVVFRPPVSPTEIAALYGEAAAGISSLRQTDLMEGARPAKALAIMACGRPVLYSGSGEGADLVRIAGSGIVVPPGNPAALAEAARAIVADPLRAAAMGHNGRQYVEEKLSWPSLVEEWLQQFEGMNLRAERS